MSGLDPIPEENGAWDYYYKIYYDDDEDADDFLPPENQNYKYTTPIAEGGYDSMDATTERDPLIPDTGDDDDDTDVWDNPNQWQVTERGGVERIPTSGDTDSTQRFEPGDASTPAGEQVPMSTRTRLPQEYGPRTAETSFITGDTQGQRVQTMQENLAWREVRGEFPLADTSKLDMRYKVAPRAGRGGGGAIIGVKMSGKDKWYRLYTKMRGDSSKSFNDHLPKEIKNALGKSLDEQFNDTNTLLDRNQKELAAKQKQTEQVEQRAGEAQKLHRDLDAMRNRIKDDDDRIRELEDAHRPLDTEEIQRLKDEKRALESDHQSKRQQLSQLQKNAKQADKIQKEINKLMLDNRGLAERLDKLRTKKDAIKPLDELKQNEEELETKIAEDKRVIADENTSPSEREAAEDQVANNEAELARVNTEIEVRERQRRLNERVKEIFKKYGWTLQAVVLAAGITISAVVLATLNGLKAATKAIGNGLKNIGKQAANALPGLISSIVSFIFKAAGQVISFLAEHAWLLILAVVAFLVERVTKRTRSRAYLIQATKPAKASALTATRALFT